MHPTYRIQSALFALLILLGACTEPTTQKGKGNPGDSLLTLADTGTTETRDPRSTPGFEPVNFTLTAEKYELSLVVKGQRPQKASTKGQVVSLRMDPKGMPRLETVRTKVKPADYLGVRGPYFHRLRPDRLQLVANMDENGNWKFTDRASNFQASTTAYDCEDFYISGEDGQLYLVPPPKPVAVSVEGMNMHFRRQDKPEGVDVPNDAAIILSPCEELLDADNAFVYHSGGLGTVILVDNIIDPELVAQAQDAGANDPFQAQGYAAFQTELKGYDHKYKGQKCPEIEQKVWSPRPDITVRWAFPETKVTIYCDRWLVVENDKEQICIDIVTCGAKLEVDSDALHVYSGCPDEPSSGCPF